MTHPEFDCPTPETHNWGCGCPTDVAAAIASCPGHEVDGPSPCRCPCEGCKHNCAAHQSAAVSAAVTPPTDHTHGLSVQHADALWDAVAIPGPRTPTYPEQHERVCRAVRDILDELTPARDEEADQTALRDRIAAAIWERQNPGRRYADCEYRWQADAEADADAVLAVLPEPADRAAALREAALHLYTALFPAVYADMGQKAAEGVNRAVSELRRMADETATTETPTVPVQHAPGKVICCADCRAKGYAVCLDEPAAGVRQDGAES